MPIGGVTGADPGFGHGGSASEAESCRCSGVESCKQSKLSVVRRALEACGLLMLKYAFSHILETLSV